MSRRILPLLLILTMAGCSDPKSRQEVQVDTTISEAAPTPSVADVQASPPTGGTEPADEQGATFEQVDPDAASAGVGYETPVTPAESRSEPARWLRRPTDEEVMRYYPEKASRLNQEGEAEMNCLVARDGSMQNCTIVREFPEDFDFGGAVLRMSRLFRMRPRTIDGEIIEGDEVRIPVTFSMP